MATPRRSYALRTAEAIRGTADDVIRTQRTRLAELERAATVDAADAAVALAEDTRKLTIPLGDLDAALHDARLRQHVIESSLTRRLQAATGVAIESQVEQVAAQLAALRAEVDRVHAAANAPDPVVCACLAVLDLLKLPEFAMPKVTWPRWSSVGSKNPKGAWVGDLFAEPTIAPSEAP